MNRGLAGREAGGEMQTGAGARRHRKNLGKRENAGDSAHLSWNGSRVRRGQRHTKEWAEEGDSQPPEFRVRQYPKFLSSSYLNVKASEDLKEGNYMKRLSAVELGQCLNSS